MRRILLITNAAAGSADQAAIDAALGVLRAEAEVEVVATESLDDLHAAVQRRGDRTVVAAGGDGSLHALIGALDATGGLQVPGGATVAPTVGLLPLGTGNDFSRAIGLPSGPEEAAAVIVAGRPVDIDVLRDDTGEVVVNVAHIGVGAEANERAEPWKERLSRIGLGVLGYAVGGFLAILGTQGWRLCVVADGHQVTRGRRRVLQVAVANGRTIGGGAQIAPDADASDGLADLTISYATGLLARLRYGIAMPSGRHLERDDVQQLSVRQVTVRARSGTFTVNSDGELSEPLRERSWQVEPAAYRILVASN